MRRKKILVAIKSGTTPGGPTLSHLRIINSELTAHFDLVPLVIPPGRLGLFNPRLTRSLIRQIRRENPDLVQIIGLELIGFHLLLATKLAGKYPILTAIHGCSSESIQLKKNLVKRSIIRALEKVTIRLSDGLFGVSEYIGRLEILSKIGSRYRGCIYNLVSPKFKHGEVGGDFRKTLGLDEEDFLVLSVGRIEKEKGFDILSEAILDCRTQKIRYIIAGNGSYLEEMKSLLSTQERSGKVFFLGYRDDVPDLLLHADAFALASRHETFCMAAAEAAILGVPLIVPPHGGLNEIVIDGVNGYVAHNNLAAEYVELATRMHDDKPSRERMSANAKRIARHAFNDQSIVAKLKETYESLIRSGD